MIRPDVEVGDVVRSPSGKSYTLLKELAKGAQGRAFIASSGGTQCFLKYITDPTPFSDQKLGGPFLAQQRRLQSVLSKVPDCVAEIHELFEYDTKYCRVDSLIAGGDLGKLLLAADLEPANYPISRRARHVTMMAYTVAEVHSHGIVHCDLKPQNVLVEDRPDGTSRCVLVDFDAGITIGEPIKWFGMTEGYAAPEQVADPFGEIGPWTDVFALGVVMFEVLLGTTPWESGWESYVRGGGAKLSAADLAAQTGASLPPEIYALLDACLALDVSERPSSKDVHAALLKHLADSPPVPELPVPAEIELVVGDRRVAVAGEGVRVLGRMDFVGVSAADTVSTRHVQLGRDDGRWYVWHLSRSNPTIVQRGADVTRVATVGDKAEIRVGDKLKMGNLVLEIQASAHG